MFSHQALGGQVRCQKFTIQFDLNQMLSTSSQAQSPTSLWWLGLDARSWGFWEHLWQLLIDPRQAPWTSVKPCRCYPGVIFQKIVTYLLSDLTLPLTILSPSAVVAHLRRSNRADIPLQAEGAYVVPNADKDMLCHASEGTRPSIGPINQNKDIGYHPRVHIESYYLLLLLYYYYYSHSVAKSSKVSMKTSG